jgi:hypothetical protein
MMNPLQPEVWLRGALPDWPGVLMPAAHSLMQVREEIEIARSLSSLQLSARPAGVASVAYHLKHIAGSLDRLLTYAEGRSLSDEQLRTLAEEGTDRESDPFRLVQDTQTSIDRALYRIQATPLESLESGRAVGRRRLPSTVLGLIIHAAEHAQRHAGQLVTTVRIVCR